MSGINPNFQKTRDFSEDAARRIAQLEDRVARALDVIANQALPKLTPTNLQTADAVAKIDDLLPCSGTFRVTLPAPDPAIAGRGVAIELQAGTITVYPTIGLVQGAASDVISTVGRYLYICDGVGFYRHADTSSGGGGSGVTFTEFSKDVGKGTSGHFDITGLAGLTAGKDVLLVQTAQPIASKGNARDEFEMDNIELTGYVVDAATIRVYWNAKGIVVGTYNFAYQVGA